MPRFFFNGLNLLVNDTASISIYNFSFGLRCSIVKGIVQNSSESTWHVLDHLMCLTSLH